MAGRKPITEEQEPAVLRALAARPLRDQALFILGMNTGFRITELLSLNVAQVWDDGNVRANVRITRAKMKNGRGHRRRSVTSRVVPLNGAASAILRPYLFARFGSGGALPHEPLFPSRKRGMRLSRWRANTIVHEVIRAAGFDDQDAYGTHSLRKRFANRIYQATKFDINLTRYVMGHCNVSTTIAYLSVNEADAVAAVMRIGQLPVAAPKAVSAG